MRVGALPAVRPHTVQDPVLRRCSFGLSRVLGHDLQLEQESTLRHLLLTSVRCRTAGPLGMVLRKLADSVKLSPGRLGEGRLESKLWSYAHGMEPLLMM